MLSLVLSSVLFSCNIFAEFVKTDIMQLLTNLFLLGLQLHLTCGLGFIHNGLGLAVYDSELSVVDYALLADDQKAALPSQVQAIFSCPSSSNLPW